MALNSSNDAIILKRQELVAALLLRGRTQREIQQALAQQMVNPETNEPYSLGTINGDVQRLERGWNKAAAKDVSKRKARQLAEIDEVKRQAWMDKDPTLVLRAIDLEANIAGTKAAVKNELTGKDGGPVVFRLTWGDTGADGGDDGASA